MFARIRKYWRSRFGGGHEERALAALDPVWYRLRYPDLSGLDRVGEVLRHYLGAGRAEGRFPNAAAEEEADLARYRIRSADFDLAAYRLLNPDLAGHFADNREFILHFIRHGRAEGRPAVFASAGAEGHDEPWTHIFSPAHYAAWISRDAGVPVFATRAAALAHFRDCGISALAPIHFDHLFDPAFYRAHYGEAEADDVLLYRAWLASGLPQGRAANEARALSPFLGQAAFPEEFDWRGYAALRGLPALSRARVLATLFEQERDWAEVAPLIGRASAGLALKIARHRLARHLPDEAMAVIEGLAGPPDSWSAPLHAFTGELRERQGGLGDALGSCAEALRLGEAGWECFRRAVTLATTMGETQVALSLLRAHWSAWRGRPGYSALVTETIGRLFDHAVHHALATFRDEPLAVTAAAFPTQLAELAGAVADLAPEPASLAPEPDAPAVLLDGQSAQAWSPGLQDDQLAAAGTPLRRHQVEDLGSFLADLPGARAAIFSRLEATPPVMRAILAARAAGIPTFYQADDLDFAPPVDRPPSDAIGAVLCRFALSLCDRAMAPTPALLAAMAPLVRDGTGLVVRPGPVSHHRSRAAPGAGERPDCGRIRIFCASTASDDHFTRAVAPALARLLRERDDTDVVLVGQFPDLANWQAAQAGEVSRWLHFPAVAPEDRWPVLAACDIAVAPAGNAGAEAAGEIVWLEAAAAAIPTVASDTATARETIVAGETGLLAADAEGWHAALAALCANADLRRRIGVWARDQVLRERSPEALASQWRALPAVPAAPVPRRPRILVVNVFFSPQSLGGATRVVEDNVRHLDRAGDYDLAVFCADEAFGTSGVLHTSRFGNVPVFRAEVPPRDDRLAADPAILPAFRRVLDLFRPDLVHFHCMQRLTASPLSECLVRGLPYVVTVHDGWWISPDQFLVDGNGLLHVPGPDLFAGLGEDPAAATAWLLRRQTLAPLLAGAARVLTVSEPFAQICRQAGMPEIAAVPNGVPDLPLPLPADPDIGGPLRLAHLGGRALHKGAHLVEAALRRGQYGNLSLLMVDGQVPPGELVQTRWGASDVVLCPPWPQDAIADLYGRTDVLLAPSIWPESFGLVAREAHHFGCWVVASDCGAMGEDVVPGLNGFLVDPADGAALDRILVKLDAAPHAYRRGTIAAPAAAARSMSAQANDLARIYAAILDQ